jgi:prepilin-type processing-associated H-X9-DG protein
LKLLPKDTAAAAFKDLNASLFWSWLKKNFESAQLPKLTDGVKKFEDELKTKQKIDLDKLLGSFDRLGFLLTLDETKKAMIPVPPKPITIAEPAIAIVLHLKNDYIYDLLKKKVPCTLKEGKNVEKMLLNIPLPPLPLKFHPLFAKSKDLLIIASNETIVDKMLEAREKGDGLVATEEFKKLSKDIELTGNGFKYGSPKLAETLKKAQEQFIATLPPDRRAAAGNLNAFINLPYGFVVFQNTAEGFLITSNSNIEVSSIVAMQATVAPTAILAGMLLPALNSAREKARRISCASNLKQIGLALKQYSMDHKDKFPAKDGAAGLEELRKQDYLPVPKIYVCPSSNTEPAKPGQPLTEKNVSYIYLGGFDEMVPADTPLAFDKPGNHTKYVNVLFADGHVTGIVMRDTSIKGILKQLCSQHKLPAKIVKALQKKAKQLSK